jgi:hypothetical protein
MGLWWIPVCVNWNVCLTTTLESFTFWHSTPYALGFVCACPQLVSNGSCPSFQPLRAWCRFNWPTSFSAWKRKTLQCYDAAAVLSHTVRHYLFIGMSHVPMTTPKAESTFSTFPENRTTGLEGNIGTWGNLDEIDREVVIIDPCVSHGTSFRDLKYKGDMDAK